MFDNNMIWKFGTDFTIYGLIFMILFIKKSLGIMNIILLYEGYLINKKK